MDIEWMTVDKLNRICQNLINENKGDYKVYLSTSGYYDGNAQDEVFLDENRRELTLLTP